MPRNVTHNAVMKLLKLPRRIGQTTITLSLDFVQRNILRDNTMAAVLSETGYRPFLDAIRGLKSRMARDPAYQAWVAKWGFNRLVLVAGGAVRDSPQDLL